MKDLVTSTTTLADVVLLANLIPTYRVPELTAINRSVRKFTVVVWRKSTADILSGVVEDMNLPIVRVKGISIRRRHRNPHGYVEREVMDLPVGILSVLFARRPDVVVAGGLGFATVQAIIFRIFCRNSRLAIHADLCECTEDGRGWIKTSIRKWMLRAADAIIVNGASGSRYVRGIGVPSERLVEIPFSIDLAEFSPSKAVNPPTSEQDTINFLYVGQFIERKGLVEFLSALSEVCKKPRTRRVIVTLVGSGPLKDPLISKFSQERFALRIVDTLVRQELLDHYRSADWLILPTLCDTWALVVNEALAVGLPLLGSIRSQAVETLVESGVNGVTFDPEDIASVMGAISAAMDCEAVTHARMRRAARNSAAKCSSEVVARGYLDLISRLKAGIMNLGSVS